MQCTKMINKVQYDISCWQSFYYMKRRKFMILLAKKRYVINMQMTYYTGLIFMALGYGAENSSIENN